MVSFFRRAPGRRSARRRAASAWPHRRIRGEQLEQRALLAANLTFAIAGQNGGQGVAVGTDAAGNVYELGTDAVYKFAPDGTPVWNTPYTASSAINQKEALAVDSSGDIYIAGNFGNGAGTPAVFGSTSLISAGGSDGYLAKLDPQGNFLWAESFGGSGDDTAYALATDAADNVYLTGHITGTATIGTGVNAKTFTDKNQDALVAKFDPAGALQWVNAYGDTGNGKGTGDGRGIAVDGQGNVFVTGDFSSPFSQVDFDPAIPGTHDLTTFFGTAFLLKLDTNGNYVWSEKLNANTTAGDGSAQGDAIAVDSQGDVYSTGTFGGPVELDPQGGDLNTSANFVFPDAYVLKVDTKGRFDWAADLHNASSGSVIGSLHANAIAVDAAGDVYSVGYFDGVANFNPNGSYLQTSAGGDDVYVSALDSQGNFLFASTVGENGTDQAYGVAVNSAAGGASLYVSGSFSNTINFNPSGAPDDVAANGIWDSFLWGLNYFHNEIGGVVWDDANGDGVRQSTENGVPGVPVALYAGTPGSGTQVASTVTDYLGLYSFSNVSINQTYYVQVSLPGGDSFTSQNTGTDLTVDSNVSMVTGDSNSFTVSPGQSLIINAGLAQAVAPLAPSLAFGIPTIGFTEGSSIATDAAGNFYVAGSFDGNSTTFGSGGNTVTLKTGANNDFVAKYSSNGTFLWVRQIVSSFWEYDPKIQIDSTGDVYLAGELTGDATVGTLAMTLGSSPTTTAFLVKLDTNGTPIWATTSVTNGVDNSVGMAIDGSGDAYLAGGFQKTAAVGSTTLTSAGGYDVFVVKYSPSGTPVWAVNYGGTGNDDADSVAIDPSGNPVITGVFAGSASFGATKLSGGLLSNAFVAKLNASDGSVAWADALTSTVDSGTFAGGAIAPMSRIAIDSSGNVYTTGSFEGTIQLDPTNGTDAIQGTNATFISKLDKNGNFLWGKAFTTAPSGYDIKGYGIAVDAKGDVFTTGSFAQTINFNPNGSPAFNLTSSFPYYDVYVSELDTLGNYINAVHYGGAGEDEGTAITLDKSGNVFVTGLLDAGPTTFGPFSVGSSSEQDILVLRLANSFGTSANQAPSFTIQGPQQALPLNAPPQTVPGFLGNIVPGPKGDNNEILTFEVSVSSDNPNLFSVPPSIDSSGTLTYTPAPGQGGTATVTVVAKNNGGTANGGTDTSAPQTFVITVDVNQPPSFTPGRDQSVLEYEPSTSPSQGGPAAHGVLGWATNLSPGPPDQASETLNFIVTYSITNLNGSTNVPPGSTALFSVAPAIDPTGKLTYTLAPDVWGTAEVSVELHNSGGTAFGGVDTSEPQTFAINVQFVNEPPKFTAGTDQTTNENSGLQSVPNWATQISAGPSSETGQKLTFVVSTDNDALFSSLPTIDPTTGTLTYTPATDVSGTANVTVLLEDNGGTASGGNDTSPPKTFAINVNFVNQPPIFTAGPNVAVDEDTGAQTIAPWATKISAGAPQQASQTLNFIVKNDNNSLFSTSGQPAIDPATGDLTFTPATDVFGVADVTVELHNSGGTANGGNDTSAAVTFTITVNFVNHAPSFLEGETSVSAEQKVTVTGPTGEVTVNWNTVTDATGNDASGYDIYRGTASGKENVLVASVGSAATSFVDTGGGTAFSPPSSNVTGLSAPVQNTPVASATGGTLANGTYYYEVAAIGNPQAVNESPSPSPQTVPGWARSIGPGPPSEAGEALNFIVSNDNPALFSTPPSIDATTGNLTYTAAADSSGVAHVTVKLHDDGGTANGGVDTSPAQTFAINVNFVNQPPSFTAGPSLTTHETPGPQTAVGWATGISAGPPNQANESLTFNVTYTTTNLDGSAYSSKTPLFAVAPAIDPTTGTLTYTPAQYQTGVAQVTVQLQNSGGGNDTSSSQVFKITVTQSNQAPSFTAGSNEAFPGSYSAITIADWATNVSFGPPSDGKQTLNFVVTNDNNALFQVQPSIVADQDANGNYTGNGDLAFTFAPGASGKANVTVQLHDSGGTANGGVNTSAAVTFQIATTYVNQVPVFTKGADQTVLENAGPQTVAGWATGISAGALSPGFGSSGSESWQGLTFIVATNNALFSSLPAIDPTTGNLTYTPAPDANGTAAVNVTLHDNGGTANGGDDTSAVKTFNITIKPVNQAPFFTGGASVQVPENAGPQTFSGWATGISPGAPNEVSSQTLNFIVNSSITTFNGSTTVPSGSQLFSVAPAVDPATGDLTFTPAPDVDGTATVSVQLHDSGGTLNGGVDTSAAQTFTIAVTFVNQPPTFLSGETTASNEESAAVTGSTGSVTVNWNALPGALGYDIYRGTTAGGEDELVGSVAATPANGTSMTFVDTGGGTADAPSLMINATGLAAPVQTAPTTSTFGGTLTAGTYYYEVTALGNPPAVNESTSLTPQTVAGWATNISAGAANQSDETLRFAVSNDNPSLFVTQPQVDPGTGDLTYTPAPYASGVAHVLVLLQNSGGTANGGQDWSGQSTATLTVNYVNQPPKFDLPGDPPAVDENSGAQTVVGFATQISPSSIFPAPTNEANQTVHFKVTGNTNTGLFAVAPAIDSTGTLTYTLNPYVAGDAQVTVELIDNGGGADTSATQTFNIDVLPVNQPPFFTSLSPTPVVVNEDSGAATLTGFAASNPGTGDTGQTVSYQVSVDNPSLFAPNSLPAISADGTLTFTPGTHAVGVANVTVTAIDNGGTANGGVDESQPVTFQVRINQIDHAPTVQNSLPAVVVNENAADVVFNNATISQVFDDIDVDLHLGDELSLSAAIDSASQNPNLLTASLSSTDPASAALTLHFASDQYGTATVDLTATDKSGLTAQDQIPVTVNQANVPPSFTAGNNVVLGLNPGPQTLLWGTQIANDPTDPKGETLNFVVNVISTTNPNLFSVPPSLSPNTDATGNYTDTATLSFTPAANQAGTATISVALQNSGGTSHGGSDTSPPQTFQISVAGAPTAVNHTYLIGSNAAASVAAGSGLLDGAQDASGLPLTAELITPPALGSVQLNANGSFTYTPSAGFQTTDRFTYAVTNGNSSSNVATVTINADQTAIIEKLYQQVLGRAPDPGGQAYWTQQVDNGQQYGAVAQGIFDSDERIAPIISNYYQQFLLRTADPAGLSYWEQVWQSSGGPEQVIAGMISSPEFYASASAARPDLSPNAAWVTALYERLLNRAPDSSGLQYWTSNLDSGDMTLVDVVNGFEYSAENFQNLTTGFFQQYLGRAPTASELADYVQQFEQGATDAQIQTEIIDLPEYRDTPPPPANGTLEFLS